MSVGQLQAAVGHLSAVHQKKSAQVVILWIIFIDNCLVVHLHDAFERIGWGDCSFFSPVVVALQSVLETQYQRVRGQQLQLGCVAMYRLLFA